MSVVIPAYNSAAQLPDAVGSVRAQNWPELEIIVVNDGSTDETDLVLERLAGSDLRSIAQVNGGPAAARNTGIVAARGEWVAFLDADDFWLPDKLATQFAAIRRQPQAGFSYTDENWQADGCTQRIVVRRDPHEPLLAELLWGNRFGTPTVIVRRECFAEVGLFDTALRTGEDWDLWLRLAACFEGVYVACPLAAIRKTTRRTEVNLRTLESCTLRVLDRLFSSSEIRERHPHLAAWRRQVYAWHYSVMAKSYLRHWQVVAFCRMAFGALRSHPAGLRHLARRHTPTPPPAILSGEARVG